MLFFTAVLPPFLDVNRPVVPQLVLFAAAVIGMDMMSMSAYALSGAALSLTALSPGRRRFVVSKSATKQRGRRAARTPKCSS